MPKEETRHFTPFHLSYVLLCAQVPYTVHFVQTVKDHRILYINLNIYNIVSKKTYPGKIYVQNIIEI